MPRCDLFTLCIYEAGVDPDYVAALKDFGTADYQELCFPPQGLASILSRNGLVVRKGKNSEGRTLWAPGPYYDRWLEHYQEHRTAFRTARSLPLELNQEILARIIVKAGADPDDLMRQIQKDASHLGSFRTQLKALMRSGPLMHIDL
jgi:hypothetical protein